MSDFVSLCMIVKDEEKVLKRCLESVLGIVDEIIIVDTGSKDKTIEIAKSFTDKVFNFKWEDDFSAARNFAASKANGDWILVLDADEYVDRENLIVGINEIKEHASKYDVYAVNIINFAGRKGENIAQHKHARIYRNNGNIKFHRKVHEQLIKEKGELSYTISSLLIYHTGYLNQTVKEKGKNERNKPLVEQELFNNKEAGFDYFNFGNELKREGRVEEALDLYVKAYQKKGEVESGWVPFCLCNIVECLIELKRFDDALKTINDAEYLYAYAADFTFLKGEIYLSQKRYDDAKSVFKFILSRQSIYKDVIKSPDYNGYFPNFRLAEIYEMEKNYDESIRYFIGAINYNKFCTDSAIRVLTILSKIHSAQEIFAFFQKNILNNKNEEFVKSILIYSLNKGFSDFALLLLEYYYRDNQSESFLINLKIDIIKNDIYKYKTDQRINSLNLLQSLRSNIIDLADIFILNQYMEECQNKRYLEVILSNSIFSSLLSVLSDIKASVNLNISNEAYIYLLEKCIIYRKFDLMRDLIDLRDRFENDLNSKIATLLYTNGYEDESIEFYQLSDEKSLDENNYVQIIKWLVNIRNIEEAYRIANEAVEKFSDDFRFYKYILTIGRDLGKDIKNIFKEAVLKFPDSEWLKDIKDNSSEISPTISYQTPNTPFQDYCDFGLVGESNFAMSSGQFHVVYVMNHVRVCGGVKVVFEHANRLIAKGINVSIVSRFPKPDWFPIRFNYIELPFNTKISKGIPNCNLVVATMWDHIQSCVDASVAPVIYFEQGDSHLFEKNAIPGDAWEFIYKQFQLPDYIFTVSSKAAGLIKEQFHRDAHVIHNAIDEKVFYSKEIYSKAKTCEKYILMVGSEHATFKGITDIIDAHTRFKKIDPTVKLYWISPNIPSEEYSKKVDRVFVNPPQDDIAELYRNASLYVSASYYETFSLPVLEAMACGCPVVTTENIGVMEYAKNDYNVLLAKIGNPSDLSEKIKKALTSDETRNKLINNALSTVSNFNWENSISRLLQFYQKVIGEKEDKFISFGAEIGGEINMYGTYIGEGKLLIKTIWGGKLLISNKDMSLMPDLVANGVIEGPLTKYLISNVKEGDTVIDVGANVGYFSILAGHKVGSTGKVIAFEANDFTFSFLRDNISINYLQDRVSLFNKAIYSNEEMISFFTTDRFFGNASIHKPNDEYYDYFLVDEGLVEKKVPAISLDKFVHDIGIELVNYVKIDIEGGEFHCLLGMEELIQSKKVETIIFELNKLRSREDANKLYNLLLKYKEVYGVSFGLINLEGKEIEYSLETIFGFDFIPSVLMKVNK